MASYKSIIITVYYESLQKELSSSLNSIMDYLDQKKDENRLKCATDFGTKDTQALDKLIENRKPLSK